MKPSTAMVHSTPVEGRTIGRYRVQKHVATGGMAEIYLATYDERGETREVVVKVILRERVRDRKFVQMFLDEARVSSTFMHLNIAQLFEVGRDADTYFYAMEYVRGDNVRALIERTLRARVYMPLAVTLTIGIRTAAALHYAHERPSSSGQLLNAVHRDVTPSNIMLGFDGSVKLLDFGIARADTRAQMTQSGTVKGKFAYMSPEQCKGQHVDRRTDVFALGIVLYELSTQRRAFRAESDFESMDRIIRGDLILPHLIHPDYPRSLENILLKALATDPAERYQTAAELGQALSGFAQAAGLEVGEAAVAGIMAQLFHVEPPRAPAAEAGARAPMSLASMLAATADPVADPSSMHVTSAGPAIGGAPVAATPGPTPMTGGSTPRPVIMGVPAPVRGRRPSTNPTPRGHAAVPAPAALGTPPSMARVVPDDDVAAGFARSSDSMPVIELDDAPEELTSSALIEVTGGSPIAPAMHAPAHAVPALAPPAAYAPPAPAHAPPTPAHAAPAAAYAAPAAAYAAPATSAPTYATPSPAAPAYASPPYPTHAPHAPHAPVAEATPPSPPYGLRTPGTWSAPAIAVGSGEMPVPAYEPRVTGAGPAVHAPDEERSRLGLWIALTALLAVGGVVAATLVLSSIGVF